MALRIFIVAGERSGDRHAARLMDAIKRREPSVEFFGIGGPAMHAVGLESIVPFAGMNVSGFWEVLRQYRTLRLAFERTLRHIQARDYDLFVPVDYPGFNLRLAEQVRRRGVPVFWYIAPQLWAWGRWRARRLAEVVDRLFVVLPFEVEFFQRLGIEAEFHGHPFLDDPGYATPPSIEAKHPHEVALLPGSRAHEQRLNLPLMLRLADALRHRNSALKFTVAIAPPSGKSTPGIDFDADAQRVLLRARYGIIKAGTSTLEAMLAGVVQVAMYRASFGTYMLGRALVSIPFVALPNIILGQCVVPEVIQTSSAIGRLLRTVERILADPDEAARQREASLQLRRALGEAGASQRIADRMLALVGRR
ncbi:MAG: lipid-A-disaccharide synthase [Candidatus Kapaibacterium sp.]|nr:MAG: lipid-A-disaccharide synthase [Candidatus Kapabacteria bacterium]